MDEFSWYRDNKANETSQKSIKYAELSEKKARANIHEDLMTLTSQMELMSNSFVAHPKYSRQRCPRKEFNKSNKEYRKSRNFTPSEWFTDVGPSLKRRPSGRKNDVPVNYVLNDNRDFLHLRKSKTFTSQEEIWTKRYSNESVSTEKSCRGFESYASGLNWREFPKQSSKVEMYDYREVDSGRMIELLQRELKTIAELAPSVILIASTLIENLSHCQECRRCHEKISASLPWILNRIQKLIKYVTTRNQETYVWPNDISYLRRKFSKDSVEETTYSSSSSRVTLIPVTPPRLIGKLEKVDPVAVSEDDPGVQILLEIQPELQKKKFFNQAKYQSKWVCDARFPVVHLKERKSGLVVQVLKPTPKPRITLKEKREVAPLREYGISFRVVHIRNSHIPAVVKVAVPQTKPITYDKPTSELTLEPVRFVDKQARLPAKNLLSVLIQQCEWNVGQLPYSVCRQKPNDKETFLEKFRTNPPELVQDLLTEAEEEEMQAQRVNELEEEVKELKDLMLEVHKNQTELGKLLLEKKVFSQLMVKLTDPKMLEEENKAVKKVSKMSSPSTSSSMVALQMKVENLKRKCSLKNRLIVTLLRGLRSNVPKELWEEVVAYAFEDSESVDEVDCDKINDFIRQTSLFLTNEEKDQKLQPSPSRTERLTAEEEPKVKGIMGAEVEDSLKNLSCYEYQASAEPKGVSSRLECSPARIWAFPVLNVPDNTKTALKRLKKQISILNVENERLWHQVNELRELLKNSVKEINLLDSNQKINMVRTTGKTVNLVIQIAEKDASDSRNGEVFPPSEMEITEAKSKSSPIVKLEECESVMAIHETEGENSPDKYDRKLSLFTPGQNHGARPKSDRRRSENDLNYVDDVNLSVHDYQPENEKLRGVLREKTYLNNQSVQGLLVRTPHPSAHEMFQNFKPVVWVPSKYMIPEVHDMYGAGPSRKHGEITNLLQKPSLMEVTEIHCAGMYSTMSNERELQTIPENDYESSSSTSRGVDRAIQRLRAKVRSLHKDMTVLRSKNDRIDKLLNRLMDDVVENSHDYEELESSLSNLKSRLG